MMNHINLKNLESLIKRKRTVKSKQKLRNELKNKTVLITGGAGSVGAILTKELLKYPVRVVRAFDIDEHALFRLSRTINDQRLRVLLGNILDKERIEMAGNNADIVIHLAAIKNIEISEFNPIEAVDVNVNGIINMIEMTMKSKPKKFLNISTDKVVYSTTLYGTTKMIAEGLISWAGNHLFPTTKFATARFGNVIESRGNVFEVWKEEIENNRPLSITSNKMNRYFFHVEEAVAFILDCIPMINSGEIFVPKMNSYNIKDLASKVSKKYKMIGARQGEKINEALLTDEEKKHVIQKKDMWIIKPYKKNERSNWL